MAGGILGAAVLKDLTAEPLAARLIEKRLDTESQASFLDALPFRVPTARRRWDPFYATEHQVVAFADDVVIDQFGILFGGAGLVWTSSLTPLLMPFARRGARGRIRDGASLPHQQLRRPRGGFGSTAPGTDRMPFDRAEPETEPTLVSLTNVQIAERRAVVASRDNRLHA